jgi:hypothetical protein
MTHDEVNYRVRSRMLYQAAETERDPALREVLYVQSERIAMKALALELKRKQEVLRAWGIPLNAA